MPTALVTGASTGFGAGVIQRLRELGWSALGTTRDLSRLPPPAVDMLALDLSNQESIDQLGTRIDQLDGGLEALVSNAGIAVTGPWEELTSDELRHQLEVNLIGTMALVRSCLPALRKGGGVIVQVSSVNGLIGGSCTGAYSASKFALEGATEALAEEVAGQGVRVVLIEPGPFRTPIVDSAAESAGRGSTGLYDELWQETDDWADWFRAKAEDPAIVVSAIVAAIRFPDAPFRIPVGKKAGGWIREHIQSLSDDVDQAEQFLQDRARD